MWDMGVGGKSKKAKVKSRIWDLGTGIW